MADPALVAVVGNYSAGLADLRATVVAEVQRSWLALSSWRDADVAAWIAEVVALVEAGQSQTVAATAAYLEQSAVLVTGSAVPAPLDFTAYTIEALRGVAAAEVYRRPAVTTYTALANGAPLDAAVELGRQRAGDLAATDLQLAKTHASRDTITRDPRVTGWRRVLEGSKSCALCIVASTQRYHREALMPVHAGCGCSVAPIYGSKDPGQIIDPGTLDEVHARIAERFGASDAGARAIPGEALQYRDALVVHEHGELGAVLADAAHDFTPQSALPG